MYLFPLINIILINLMVCRVFSLLLFKSNKKRKKISKSLCDLKEMKSFTGNKGWMDFMKLICADIAVFITQLQCIQLQRRYINWRQYIFVCINYIPSSLCITTHGLSLAFECLQCKIIQIVFSKPWYLELHVYERETKVLCFRNPISYYIWKRQVKGLHTNKLLLVIVLHYLEWC